jgi:acyl carrier protein
MAESSRRSVSVTEIEAGICDILMQSGLPDGDVPLTADTPLVEKGLNLDSVRLLELIVSVEESFDVAIEDEELTLELLATIGSLASFVHRKLGRGAGEVG